MSIQVYFTSDLHLSHPLAADKRGFSSVEEHDETVIENINARVGKRAKLFVLGDVCFTKDSLKLLSRIKGTKELVAGNHDNYQTKAYLSHFTKVSGFRGYQNFFLSHCPMHPQEMYRKRGNLHGHIHANTNSPLTPLPHFNVNIELNNMQVWNFDEILERFDKYESE